MAIAGSVCEHPADLEYFLVLSRCVDAPLVEPEVDVLGQSWQIIAGMRLTRLGVHTRDCSRWKQSIADLKQRHEFRSLS